MRPLSIVLLLTSVVVVGYAADSPVADAAQSRDVSALRALVKQHASASAPQADGTTALHWAAHWNDVDAVNVLLGAGADAKAVNRYGATPLSEAAGLGNAAVIEALLKAGADPNTRVTSDGETVLMTTARSGNLEAVKALLSHGADVNATETYKGQTALMWAADECHPEVVKLLLKHGADWKIRSSYRETKLPKLIPKRPFSGNGRRVPVRLGLDHGANQGRIHAVAGGDFANHLLDLLAIRLIRSR